MIESPFGNLLDTYRRQKKLTLKQLGDKASVSAGYLSLLIGGKKGRPSEAIIEKLAKALKLTKEEHSQLLQAAEETDKPQANSFRSMTPSAAGISAVLNEESLELLFGQQAGQSTQLIRIQDIWLSEPFSYASKLREVLSANKPNLSIQILLLDPADEHIPELRQAALGITSKDYIRNQLRTAIDEFKAVGESLGHNCKQFEVKTFYTVPSIMQIVCDEISYIGFYLYGKQSQRANQLEINRSSPLGRLFDAEFLKVWDADTTTTKVRIPK